MAAAAGSRANRRSRLRHCRQPSDLSERGAPPLDPGGRGVTPPGSAREAALPPPVGAVAPGCCPHARARCCRLLPLSAATGERETALPPPAVAGRPTPVAHRARRRP
uniref:Uncharacterized protein n=2 Tax=Oryza sativa subsp. japonica TaxID=39947 RepID=Q5VM73_ORYSJ|nr:hypothetical protein [Oryza sativa Japonica Group]BAD69452.1 hypothetical protein [Oryza sativa Japonica Group]